MYKPSVIYRSEPLVDGRVVIGWSSTTLKVLIIYVYLLVTGSKRP